MLGEILWTFFLVILISGRMQHCKTLDVCDLFVFFKINIEVSLCTHFLKDMKHGISAKCLRNPFCTRSHLPDRFWEVKMIILFIINMENL